MSIRYLRHLVYRQDRAFEKSFLNGHEAMTNVIGKIYADWWRRLDNREISTKNLIEEEKFFLLLKEAVINKDIKYAKKLMIEWTTRGPGIIAPVERALSFTLSHRIFDKLVNIAQEMEYNENNKLNIYRIIRLLLKQGSFELVLKIINNRPMQISDHILWALSSSRDDSLNFVRLFYKDEDIYESFSVSRINNKEVALELLYNTEKTEHEVLILSCAVKVFEPYEYVNLLMERIGCLGREESENIAHRMKQDGEDYRAKIFVEEMPICKNNI